MEIFNIIAGVASILGLLFSIIGMVFSGCTLYKVHKIDKSQTVNKINRSSIGGDYVGRDRG